MKQTINQPLMATPAKSLRQFFSHIYFNFKGRASRSEYSSIMLCALYLGLFSVLTIVGFPLLMGLLFFPVLGVIVRRLHDIGYSGKWGVGLVTAFITLTIVDVDLYCYIGYYSTDKLFSGDYGNSYVLLGDGFIVFSILVLISIAIFLCVLGFKEGDKGENKYGPSPEYMPVNEGGTCNNQHLVAAPAKSLWQLITQNYLNFKGRVRRREFATIVLCCMPLIGLIISKSSLFDYIVEGKLLLGSLGVLLLLILFCPVLSVLVRRLHDMGYGARWSFVFGLVSLSPLLLSILILDMLNPYMNYIFSENSYYGNDDAWIALILFITMFLFYIIVVGVLISSLFLLDGDKTENKYGPSPKYMPIDEYVAGNNPL